MFDTSNFLQQLFLYLLFAQLFIAPLLCSVLFINPSRIPLDWNIRIQKSILLLMILPPLLIAVFTNDASKANPLMVESKSFSTLSSAEGLPKKIKGAIENKGGLDFDGSYAELSLGLSDTIHILSSLIIFAGVLGLALFTAKLLVTSYALRQLRRAQQDCTHIGNIRVYHCNNLKQPFSSRLSNAEVFLPAQLQKDSEEYQLILEHELNHLRCNHHLWSLAEKLLQHFFWINPLLWAFCRRGELIRELQCDQLTVADSNPITYSKLLISSAERVQSQTTGFATQAWLSQKTLKRRLHMLIKPATLKRKLIAIPTLSFIVSLALITHFNLQSQDEYLEQLALHDIQQSYQKNLSTRPSIDIEQVPATLTRALLQHEDQGFYDHKGISLKAVARATLSNIGARLSGKNQFVAGGSTITQQLAKSFLNEKRSLKRKFKEAKLARIIEANFTKEDILEMYLNRVYFGNGAWGLASAATTYYSKPYQNLSLSEAAMLIPFLEAPKKYNMIDNPQLANARQLNLLSKIEAQ